MIPRKRTVKVAVVGSGLAGLTAAYKLAKASELREVHVEVHLFEKAPTLGMDCHSVSVPIPGQQGKQRVDVPMRSFQGGYYPQLISLYQELGVSFREADFSYSFSTLKSLANNSTRSTMTNFIYNGASGTKGIGMPSSMSSKMDGSVTSLVEAYAVFAFSALLVGMFYLRLIIFSLPLHIPEWLSWPLSWTTIPFRLYEIEKGMTLRQWKDITTPTSPLSKFLGLDSRWRDFVEQVMVPLFSAVCTAGSEDIWEHPVEEFLDYIYLTLGTHHYVVLNGVQDVVHRITALLHPSQIHTSSAITGLEYHSATEHSIPTVSVHCGAEKSYHGFSHVIFATQANHSIPLLQSYLDTLPDPHPKNPLYLEEQRTAVSAQIDCLQTFKYVHAIVINHTDPSLLPSAAQDRRDLNLIVAAPDAPRPAKPAAHCVDASYAMATHVLPRLAGVYQTTNPIVPPAPAAVISVAHMQRAVVTPASKAALRGLWRERARTAGWRWGCAGADSGVLGELQGVGARSAEENEKNRVPGIWFCGSYAHCGIPLLEGCVVSATNVVDQGIRRCEGI
ncbi:hypothetical protein PHLGIDRAFT_128687 [Phlebiopsis gigantea 11061_1 CR5-6]|uniref:Amine oxidase domain-containing protein n=1 Tax=Phlebiopsis gigantea (strain 11061_1 CR5-6) TaxID=745531 RepID=A0A0C3S915_PHLG1|nr:hypothetical protein PHLGIDRAFT_128687 [Phlebiopsis gigantea 11061_1 CR5-6]